MIQSRWNVVLLYLLAGVLLCIFLAYSFNFGRKTTVLTVSEPYKPATLPNRPKTKLEVAAPPKSNPTAAKLKPAAPPKSALKPLPSYADRLASASFTEVEDAYYNRLKGVHVKCNNAPHIGRSGDGGWEVCLAPAFKPQKPCLIYSFGVNNVWEFDEIMARDYGCVVRAYDPSMKVNDHVHTPGPVNFYKIGLGATDKTPSSGWKIMTFQSLLTKHGETEKTLDLVKMDIEYSEWGAFDSMLQTGVLKRTKQLLFETHTADVQGTIPLKDVFLRYHKVLDGIEALGFRRFFRHDNPYGIGAVGSTRGKSNDPIYRKSKDLRRTCCNELYYVNLNLAKNMTGLTSV